MRRVVITGRGIVSSLGNSIDEVTQSLKNAKSGIVKYEEWNKFQIRSNVGGRIVGFDELLKEQKITKKRLLCMPQSSKYAVAAANQAIVEAGLTLQEIGRSTTGCIVGTGVSCVQAIYSAGNLLHNASAKKISPYNVLHSMSSSISANLANVYAIKGVSYSISSACATSAHCIGNAVQLIKNGIVDTVLTGGAEDINALVTASFSAMRIALSTQFNDTPAQASRPFDRDRDGFVISGGAGILVLEDYQKAKQRGAKIYGEIIGYAANSDGFEIVQPEPNGSQIAACMTDAIISANISPSKIDYICAHGTSTPIGDAVELQAIKKVFDKHIPYISSTKSLGGHPIAAAGVHELIHCTAMMENNFIAPSSNIENLDHQDKNLPIVQKTFEYQVNVCISNSFGFGGSNGVLVLRKHNE